MTTGLRLWRLLSFGCVKLEKFTGMIILPILITFLYSAQLKKFSTLKDSPFPAINTSIKVHRSALVFLPGLIHCQRCEKSARESRNSRHFDHGRENIHARTHARGCQDLGSPSLIMAPVSK